MKPSYLANLVALCAQSGLKNLVLSPGSRVAPLALAFDAHPQIQTHSVVDERAAAFIALGMSQQFLSQARKILTNPLPLVGIACTSGSALYNYAPAVAEAFFQQVPLLILSADRPPEWINQWDGQTIFQAEIYGKHVKGSFQMPVDMAHPDAQWHAQRMMQEAIELARLAPCGPVHINFPFREPFYPETGETWVADGNTQAREFWPARMEVPKSQWGTLLDTFLAQEKILIIGGQHTYSPNLCKSLNLLRHDFKIPILGDLISNLHSIPESIQHHDLFLRPNLGDWEGALRPDLLITFGLSVLSKPLKKILRRYPPQQHWHISPDTQVADTFQSLTRIIQCKPEDFFERIYGDLDFHTMLERDEEGEERPYYVQWQEKEEQAKQYRYHFNFEAQAWSELEAFSLVMEAVPKHAQCHLANSMPVRYANLMPWEGYLEEATGLLAQPEVFANRGTSGIDGANSTALGAALARPDIPCVLLTGDLAFFYDRNGLWVPQIPPNLRIILFNNQGGNIFRLIPGPREQPGFERLFETPHQLKAKNTCQDMGLSYVFAQNRVDLVRYLEEFFQEAHPPGLLEIFTDREQNAEVYHTYLQGFSLK